MRGKERGRTDTNKLKPVCCSWIVKRYYYFTVSNLKFRQHRALYVIEIQCAYNLSMFMQGE